MRWRAACEKVVVVSKVELGSPVPSPGVRVTKLQPSDVVLELGEDEEPAEEEEGADPKKNLQLQWQADTNISKSAFLVNSVEH